MAKWYKIFTPYLTFAAILVVSLLLAEFIGYYWTAWFPSLIPTRAAQGSSQQAVGVGEQFEVLTAIFTLAAFVGVLITLWYQRQDLELQRADAREQRELAGEERMVAAQDQVRRETFQLLEAWQQIVHNTQFGEISGRRAYVAMADDLDNQLVGGRPQGRGAMDAEGVKSFYDRFYRGATKAALGNYFRLLYHIIRYIDRSILSAEDKHDLVRIVRAHLSEPELHLLFFDRLSRYGVERMKPLIEKYDLLQNYSFGEPEQEQRFYPQTFERHMRAAGHAGYV